MNLKERISEGVKASFVAQVVYALGTGALMIILARYLLTPDEYGLLYFALSILGVAQLVATLGLPKAGAKYLNEYLETDPGQIPHILRRTLTYTLAVTSVVCLALVTLSGPVATRLGHGEIVPFLVAGAAYVLFAGLDMSVRLAFQGINKLTWAAVVKSVSAVARLVFAVAFVLMGFDALGALFGYIVGFALGVAVGLWILYSRFYRTYDTATPDPSLSKKIVSYSLPLSVMNGAELLDKQVDSILIGFLMNPTAVGFYVLGKQIVDFASIPAVSLGATVAPALGTEKAGNRMQQAARLYEQSFVHMLLLYVPAGVGLFLVAEPTVRYVFGSEYLGAVPVLQIFSVWLVILGVAKVTTNPLDYLGLAGARARIRGAMAVSNFVLNLILIPRIGVAGAALATVVTTGIYVATCVYFMHRELSLNLDYLVKRGVLVCAVGVAMGIGVSIAVPYVSGLLTLAAVIGVGVVIWATTATASGALDVKRVMALLS
ncbi:oligosaccharide flippase family protein [Halobium salinum]|uniref:Oligosaccharide flippase family protein n=1 Tax=Halobium salinum TaxID=1364940 RepID=A0ABD5PAA0_9EURY|nr:oligosaccharide flippase family protein [Halobium salinum]